MRFAIAVHGTRGDVEPAAAVARELARRGHLVRMAVPPNLVAFAESAGLAPVLPYGPDSLQQLADAAFRHHRDWRQFLDPAAALRQARAYVTAGWQGMSDTLTTLSADADLILTGTTCQEIAGNVAEFRNVPLAALHYFPARANTHLLPVRLPLRLLRPAWAMLEWGFWRLQKAADDEQRHTLGLPRSRTRAIRRMTERGALEIQAYDEVLFPGIAAEMGPGRPVIGALSLQLPTAHDEGVAEWIAKGRAPIYFGFGNMPVDDPRATVRMITQVTAALGERALIAAGVWAIDRGAPAEHVLVVESVNHAATFPSCRAVVHHGGAGTTAAGIRAGVPTLVLWVGAEQPVWARQVRRLGVGSMARLSATTPASLRAALQTVLTPRCAARAREVAEAMTAPARSVVTAADLLEQAASRRVGTSTGVGNDDAW